MGARKMTQARGGGSGREIVVGLVAAVLRRLCARLLDPEGASPERVEGPGGARAEVEDMIAGWGNRRNGAGWFVVGNVFVCVCVT
jgi:hypothetical protein